MKKLNKLLMFLLLCVAISACGSDSDNSDADANAIFNSQFNNTSIANGCGSAFACNGTKSLNEYRSDVANMLFAPSGNYEMTFQGYSNDLHFDNLWIFNYSYTDLDTEFFKRGAGLTGVLQEDTGFTTKAQVRDSILELIDGASQFAPISNQVFDIQVGNNVVGAIYRIDLTYPIEANPIIKYGTSDGYYFFSAN